VEYERYQAKGREMQYERRTAPLLEQHEKPDDKPEDTDDGEEYDRRRPPRQRIDIFEIGEIFVVRE
jgi:hypothetical protein